MSTLPLGLFNTNKDTFEKGDSKFKPNSQRLEMLRGFVADVDVVQNI